MAEMGELLLFSDLHAKITQCKPKNSYLVPYLVPNNVLQNSSILWTVLSENTDFMEGDVVGLLMGI